MSFVTNGGFNLQFDDLQYLLSLISASGDNHHMTTYFPQRLSLAMGEGFMS